MINEVTSLRLPNGKSVDFVDWSDTPLFSTVDMIGGWTDYELDFFTYVEGDFVTGTSNAVTRRIATDRDTNAKTPGALDSSEEMLVYGIKPEYLMFQIPVLAGFDLTAATILGSYMGLPIPAIETLGVLLFRCRLSVTVAQKMEIDVGLDWLNTGFGGCADWGVNDNADVVGNTRGYASAGVLAQASVQSLQLPIHIAGGNAYRVTLTNPTGAAVSFREDTASIADPRRVIRMGVVLDGLRKRALA